MTFILSKLKDFKNTWPSSYSIWKFPKTIWIEEEAAMNG
jgi:hypothetical protein